MTGGHEEGTRGAGIDRREFLRLAGASMALAGLDGCSRLPAEHILPYVDNRPELTPGVGQHYATAMCIDGVATGLIVESHTGRPTKVEGNPDHPASLGASGVMEQASVWQLYDPDRATSSRIGGSRVARAQADAMLSPATLRARVGARGERLRLLIEPSSSPLDEAMLARVLDAYPAAVVHMYAPGVDASRPRVVQYDLSHADVILSVESDFLSSGPFHLRYARQFADNRRLATPTDAMNRLYVVESSFTPTGVAADHRFAVRPRDVGPVLRALLGAVGSTGEPSGAPNWVGAVARDLAAHRGRSVVIVGDRSSDDERALGDALNAAIGAAGTTTWYAPSPLIGLGRPVPARPLAELTAAMQSKAVDTLIVVGGNPSYASPGALQFSELLRSVPNAGYIGLYENETARDVRWFVPLSHYLESWGDARAWDGTLSIVQPLVKPLHDSTTPAETYAVVAGMPRTSAYDLLQSAWGATHGSNGQMAWEAALRKGVVDGTAFPRQSGATAGPTAVHAVSPATGDSTVDVVFELDPKAHDGAFSNNGWLQELPAPLTQLAWGNAALGSSALGKRLGVSDGEAITLRANGRSLALPLRIVPGHADDTITVHFGYGREGAESVARGVGTNVYPFWPGLGVRTIPGVSVSAGGAASGLTIVQTHRVLDASKPVRSATLQQYRAAPEIIGDRPGRALSLYPGPAVVPGVKQWAMTIDLSTCIGCAACMVACQAENNIPVVGASETRNARAMHWIRVDTYFAERPGGADALVQPMLCQHCEKAPCEYVCPVEATTHSDDGLNEMVYNRCVGTRFCSNNCPYKVRRFNWFDYNRLLSETELMQKNPNVTVRERGVMEKCTFCVQRIREAEIAAGRSGRELVGSDVTTACQQACPTNAIVFGSLTEPESEVVRRRGEPRSYAALNELGTEPRVRYLARVRNVNDALATGE